MDHTSKQSRADWIIMRASEKQRVEVFWFDSIDGKMNNKDDAMYSTTSTDLRTQLLAAAPVRQWRERRQLYKLILHTLCNSTPTPVLTLVRTQTEQSQYTARTAIPRFIA